MTDWTFANLTTAIVGIASTTAFQVQSTSSYVVEVSNGTVSIQNLNISSITTGTIPGWLTGRRPLQGQLYPRGVYNK